MDILGPFSQVPCQLKFLIMEIDCFTKWIEVDAMTKIIAENILKFFKTNIMAWYGIPKAIITNNET